ncbi:MAG: hypothetical protein ACK5JS_01750 [Mangrovibacterium sp.]
MKRKLQILILLSFFLLVSCQLKNHMNSSEQSSKSQEVHRVIHREEWQIDTVHISLPESHFAQMVPADSGSKLQTSLARSEARILPSGKLFHRLEHTNSQFQVELPKVITEWRTDSLTFEQSADSEEFERLKFTPRTNWFLLFVVAWCVIRRNR